MAYIVTVTHNGTKWPLRGTTWAYDISRAQRFDTKKEAQDALDNAKKFMKPSIYKKAAIEQVD